MSKDLESKQEKDPNREAISKTKGKIIFAVVSVLLFGLFLYFNLSGSKDSAAPIPTPTASTTLPTTQPTDTPTPVDTLTPVINKEASGKPTSPTIDSSVPGALAVIIATKLSARDWTQTSDSVINRISDSIDPSYLPTVVSKIKAWDWAGCIKTQCIIGATIGKTTLTVKDVNNLDVIQVVSRYRNYNKALSSDTWHIHMRLQADGKWRATAISGPGF